MKQRQNETTDQKGSQTATKQLSYQAVLLRAYSALYQPMQIGAMLLQHLSLLMYFILFL